MDKEHRIKIVFHPPLQNEKFIIPVEDLQMYLRQRYLNVADSTIEQAIRFAVITNNTFCLKADNYEDFNKFAVNLNVDRALDVPGK